MGNILGALTSLDENLVMTKYLYLYLYLSYHKDSLLVPLMKGTTNVSLNMRDIQNVIVSIPNIDTQMKVIERIGKIKHLEDKIAEAKLQMEEFKKSYYTMIFDGI